MRKILTAQSLLHSAQLHGGSVRGEADLVQVRERRHQLYHLRMIPMRGFQLMAATNGFRLNNPLNHIRVDQWNYASHVIFLIGYNM
jgi:hypothetical protein